MLELLFPFSPNCNCNLNNTLAGISTTNQLGHLNPLFSFIVFCENSKRQFRIQSCMLCLMPLKLIIFCAYNRLNIKAYNKCNYSSNQFSIFYPWNADSPNMNKIYQISFSNIGNERKLALLSLCFKEWIQLLHLCTAQI